MQATVDGAGHSAGKGAMTYQRRQNLLSDERSVRPSPAGNPAWLRLGAIASVAVTLDFSCGKKSHEGLAGHGTGE